MKNKQKITISCYIVLTKQLDIVIIIVHDFEIKNDGGNIMKIIKRSGAEVTFDPEKIIVAITKANESVVPSSRMSAIQIKLSLTEYKREVIV